MAIPFKFPRVLRSGPSARPDSVVKIDSEPTSGMIWRVAVTSAPLRPLIPLFRSRFLSPNIIQTLGRALAAFGQAHNGYLNVCYGEIGRPLWCENSERNYATIINSWSDTCLIFEQP